MSRDPDGTAADFSYWVYHERGREAIPGLRRLKLRVGASARDRTP